MLSFGLTLRLMGNKKLEAYIDLIIKITAEAAYFIEADPCFELLNRSNISVLVFRYCPNGLQGCDLCEVQSLYQKGYAYPR
ncbi:MAG: hypothetical protein ABI045_00080 [Flavobacteriales bacterium]